jgi:hypothetical protein
MFNMMGSPYAMMEADAMTYGKAYRVSSLAAAAAALSEFLRTVLGTCSRVDVHALPRVWQLPPCSQCCCVVLRLQQTQ